MNIGWFVHAPTYKPDSRWGLCGPFLTSEEGQEALRVFKANRRFSGLSLAYRVIPDISQEILEDSSWAKACLDRERVLVDRRKYTPEPVASFAYHAFVETLVQPQGLDRADDAYRRFYRRLNGLLNANQIGKQQFNDVVDAAINDQSERRLAAKQSQFAEAGQ